MNKNKFGQRKRRIMELEKSLAYYKNLMHAYAAAVQAERDWSAKVKDQIVERVQDLGRVIEDKGYVTGAMGAVLGIVDEAFDIRCPGRVYDDPEEIAEDNDVIDVKKD